MGVVRVVATLDAPVVLTDDLHLDALLMSAHPLMRQTPITRGTPASALVCPPIPVASLSHAGATAYLCTAAQVDDAARATSTHAVTRRDTEDLARKVNTSTGPGKNRLQTLPLVVTPTLTWYAVGDRRGIRLLLRRVTAVGSWRAHGYGLVRAWHVETLETLDPQRVLVAAGRAQRHLPACWTEWADGVTTGAVLPPYWHPARQVVPIVRTGQRAAVVAAVLDLVGRLADPRVQREHRQRHRERAEARRRAAQ